MSYNGWSNYETWNVKLWIDNEEGSYLEWRERTRECWAVSGHDKDDTIYRLSQCLKEEFSDNVPELSGCYAELLNAALSEVDWYEIASAMVEDEELEEDAEEETAEAED